jgi:signal transduction histidine kinase
MIGRVQTLFKPDLEHRNIRMHIFSPEDLEINADPDLIDQIMINLVKNAMEALQGQPDAMLRITASDGDNGASIQVKDNGPGIPDEILENIFVPFYTTKETGSGIGLSLSRQIMRQHRGNITVNSEEGQGTSFVLRF